MGSASIESLEPRRLFAVSAPGGGLRGEYFANEDFTGASVVRQDAIVSFNFFNGEIAPGLGADTASVRWTGQVKPAYTETYTFKVISDDGARLWVTASSCSTRSPRSPASKSIPGRSRCTPIGSTTSSWNTASKPARRRSRCAGAAPPRLKRSSPARACFPPLQTKLENVVALAAAKYTATLADLAEQYRGVSGNHEVKRNLVQYPRRQLDERLLPRRDVAAPQFHARQILAAQRDRMDGQDRVAGERRRRPRVPLHAIVPRPVPRDAAQGAIA
jgi:hypothetical protein